VSFYTDTSQLAQLEKKDETMSISPGPVATTLATTAFSTVSLQTSDPNWHRGLIVCADETKNCRTIAASWLLILFSIYFLAANHLSHGAKCNLLRSW